MKQREIWIADLNPVVGSEQRGIRPVLVISGNSMNDHLGIGIVCPITSNVKSYAGCLTLKADQSNGLSQDSEVITFQVRTISRQRLIEKIGEVTESEMDTVKKGLMEILTY